MTKELKNFQKYFEGLKKTEKLFLKAVEEIEDLNLEKEFNEEGECLYEGLWDDYGSGEKNEVLDKYLELLEREVNGEDLVK